MEYGGESRFQSRRWMVVWGRAHIAGLGSIYVYSGARGLWVRRFTGFRVRCFRGDGYGVGSAGIGFGSEGRLSLRGDDVGEITGAEGGFQGHRQGGHCQFFLEWQTAFSDGV